jgi:hypothetical protein
MGKPAARAPGGAGAASYVAGPAGHIATAPG